MSLSEESAALSRMMSGIVGLPVIKVTGARKKHLFRHLTPTSQMYYVVGLCGPVYKANS